MGLFRAIHDMFYPPVESHNECLRREVRDKVHSFRNQATVETQQLKQAQEKLSEVARVTRRTIKRLEIAKARSERGHRHGKTTTL